MEFKEMNLDKKLLDAINLLGFKEATGIQEKCIPQIKKGHDVVGQSLTGSGKTAAFGLPILEKVVAGAGIQVLVLTPTRELCAQVRDHLELMAKYLPLNIISIYGGVGFFQQMDDLKIAEIIVATPGRLLDHMGRGNVKLNTVKFVILDEADKMFEMGFEEDVDRILRTTPKTRQTVMFSATMPRAAQNIIKKYLKNPVFVQEKLHVDRSLLKQSFYSLRREEKFPLLVHLLKQKTAGPAIVFCGTKRTVDTIASKLRRQHIEAMPVHGDLRQSKRQQAVNLFKEAKIDVLVATDVAARGLDIKDVTHVYNYDVPRTHEEYTHRIGRTARAGKKGDAVTLLSERDYDNFGKIIKFGRLDIRQEVLPQFEMIADTTPFHKQEGFGHGRSSRQEYGRERQSYPRQNSYGGQRNSFRTDYSSRGPSQSQQYGKAPQRTDYRQRGFDSLPNENRMHAYERQSYHRQKYGNASSQGFRQTDNRPAEQARVWQSKETREGAIQSHKDSYSPRSFGKEKHSQSPWVEQKAEKELARTTAIKYHNEIKPGLDVTPRTLEPLFPTSHYHPEHEKHKVLLKKSHSTSEATGEHKSRGAHTGHFEKKSHSSTHKSEGAHNKHFNKGKNRHHSRN